MADVDRILAVAVAFVGCRHYFEYTIDVEYSPNLLIPLSPMWRRRGVVVRPRTVDDGCDGDGVSGDYLQ